MQRPVRRRGRTWPRREGASQLASRRIVGQPTLQEVALDVGLSNHQSVGLIEAFRSRIRSFRCEAIERPKQLRKLQSWSGWAV